MWSGTHSRGAQILQPHVTDPVECFMDMDRLMIPVLLLHARAEKTDPVARMLLASLQRSRGSMEVLSAETDGGLKLNCNIKFCCELSYPWCFIMTSLCQMHCYCLTSMNTSFIHLRKISISAYIAWVLEITLLTFFNSSLAFSCRTTINSLMYFYVDHFLSENICKALFP